jgi:NitT/TauT family transport system substrate-binding protein
MHNHITPRKTPLWLTALILVAGLILSGCTGQNGSRQSPSSTAETGIVIGLTYVPNIQFAPFYIAEHNNLFADASTTVSLRHHGDSEGLFTALTSGDENLVIAGGDEILEARTQGLDVIAISPYYTQYPARFIVKANSDIHTIADLKGKRIGLPGKFGENWYALLVALNQAGMTEADVTITEIGYTQQAALTTDKVDAVVGFTNGDAVTFTQAGIDIRQIDPAVDLVSICIATTEEFANQHSDDLRAIITGINQAISQAKTNPDQAITIAGDYIPDFNNDAQQTARAVLEATSQLFPDSENSQLDPAQWDAMAQAMANVLLIPQNITGSDAMTNKYR